MLMIECANEQDPKLDSCAAADYSLSNELAELHHANSLQADDPNNGDKMGASRYSVVNSMLSDET